MASQEDLTGTDLETIGQAYLASKMTAWEDAYDAFNDFISCFKREFGPGKVEGESIGLYDEMMEKSLLAMGEEPVYEKDIMDVPEIQHAFLYGGNSDVSPPGVQERREVSIGGRKGVGGLS